jgi:hypothetical protein
MFSVKSVSGGDASGVSAGCGAWRSLVKADGAAVMAVKFASATKVSSVSFRNAGAAFVELFVTNQESASASSVKSATLLMPVATLSLAKNDAARHSFALDRFKPAPRDMLWTTLLLVFTQPFHAPAEIGFSDLVFNGVGERAAGDIDVDGTVTEVLPPPPPTTVSSSAASSATAAAAAAAAPPPGKPLAGVRVSFSGLIDDERKLVRQILIDLGGEYAPDWDDRCTHLVAKSLVKSDKQTKALAKGVPVVSSAWLHACKSANARVAEAPHSLTAPPPVVAAAATAVAAVAAVAEKHSDASASPPPTKKAKVAPKKTAPATETPLGGGKKLVKTLSNRYILEEEGVSAAAAAAAVAVAGAAATTAADLTDELTEPMVASAAAAAASRPEDETLPLSAAGAKATLLGKGGPLHELPELFGGKRLFFHFADPLSRDAQRTRALARAFGAHVDDYVEDETEFLITDRPFDAAMQGAREDNEELKLVNVRWFQDALTAGKLIAVADQHRVSGDE